MKEVNFDEITQDPNLKLVLQTPFPEGHYVKYFELNGGYYLLIKETKSDENFIEKAFGPFGDHLESVSFLMTTLCHITKEYYEYRKFW